MRLRLIATFAMLISIWGNVVRSQLALAEGAPVSQISQHGITWTFDHDYTAGQFANGDWWVIGPVMITTIDPPSRDVDGRTPNGSMLSPSPTLGMRQGYDSSMYGPYKSPTSYDPTLNVALGVSSTQPLRILANSSLVSTISVPAADSRPQLKTAAILTILSSAPSADSFRPPYSGSDKTVRFNKAQLQWSLLLHLKAPANAPSMNEVAAYFERPWIDHVPGWTARYTHPSENMPDYGRDLCARVSVAALSLHMDLPNADKETLLIRYVQLGIDLYGILNAGGELNWVNNGGHASGRKWPILFAGLMLNDAGMQAIGANPLLHFGEDDQTFFVEETSPGVMNGGAGGYTPAQAGLAEWGITHRTDPNKDSPAWTANYRQCCTAIAWSGFVLSARLMNAKELWAHDALFEYQDRYMQVTSATGAYPGWRCSNIFVETMWDTYRDRVDAVVPAAPTGLKAERK